MANHKKLFDVTASSAPACLYYYLRLESVFFPNLAKRTLKKTPAQTLTKMTKEMVYALTFIKIERVSNDMHFWNDVVIPTFRPVKFFRKSYNTRE